MHLSLTSGHTFVVGPDAVEMPQRFHRMAVLEGCIPEGMAALPDDEPAPDTKMDLIVAAIKKMLDENKEGEFNGDGKPDVRKLSHRVGFTVLADERNAAWQRVNDEDQG